MEKYVADTHTILWYAQDHPKLSLKAKQLLDRMETGNAIIYLSIMSLIEMDYLVDKKKINAKLPHQILELSASPKSALQVLNIDAQVYHAFVKVPPKAIPELPDRIITATALAYSCPLITKDSEIRRWNKIESLW